MVRIGVIVGAGVLLLGAVLLGFLVHERPVHHIEKQVSNVTITG